MTCTIELFVVIRGAIPFGFVTDDVLAQLA